MRKTIKHFFTHPAILGAAVFTGGALAACNAGPAASTSTMPDPDPRVIRLGGSPPNEVEVVSRRGETHYRAGSCRVTTPLPEGYPRPTPPDAVEIKHYPPVRRAEILGEGSRDDGMYGRRSSRAFWPLFNHIKARDIAMTAPVEMDYRAGDVSQSDAPGEWSMSFLYRTPDLGPEGRDGDIIIYDAPQTMVLSVGVRGSLTHDRILSSLKLLRSYLQDSEEWREAGDPRTLAYNGPDAWPWNRWHEVQLPIEPVPPPENAEVNE